MLAGASCLVVVSALSCWLVVSQDSPGSNLGVGVEAVGGCGPPNEVLMHMGLMALPHEVLMGLPTELHYCLVPATVLLSSNSGAANTNDVLGLQAVEFR